MFSAKFVKFYREDAFKNGVTIHQFPESRCTVVVKPRVMHGKPDHYEVAVALCSWEDDFKDEIGFATAYHRLICNEGILVRACGRQPSEIAFTTAELVTDR